MQKIQNPRIGAHVTTAGGLQSAISKARDIDAECIQIFSSPPQQWKGSTHSLEEIADFVHGCQAYEIRPIYIHGAYLMNLASEIQDLQKKSVVSVMNDMIFASEVKAEGVIFHFGSIHGGWINHRKKLTEVVQKIVDSTPSSVNLIVENSAGAGDSIGWSLDELALIKNDVNRTRLLFCIDTAHIFAAGYDIRHEPEAQRFVSLVGSTIGWDSVSAIHANDSKIDLGGKRDRHENIGQGAIGIDGFRAIMSCRMVQRIPFILETPGLHREGPNKENIDRLKKIRSTLYDI